MSGNEAKGKWRLWSGVVAVFIVGAIVGGLSATALIRGHFLQVMKGGPPPGVHKPIAERLTADLALTPDQRAEVERIVRDFEPRFKEFEVQARTEIRGVMSEMETRIREILTPEQQVKYDAGIKKMNEEMERRGARRHGWDGGRHERGPGE
jgi:Spy/CpxP family protein refolding chaperone